MSRTKREWTGTIHGISGMIWVPPLYENTETAPPKFEGHDNRRVPALDCELSDGRRVFMTFENKFSADWAGTSRARYVESMRRLAKTLTEMADQFETR